VHRISALSRKGTRELCQAVMRRLDEVVAEQALGEGSQVRAGHSAARGDA